MAGDDGERIATNDVLVRPLKRTKVETAMVATALSVGNKCEIGARTRNNVYACAVNVAKQRTSHVQ